MYELKDDLDYILAVRAGYSPIFCGIFVSH